MPRRPFRVVGLLFVVALTLAVLSAPAYAQSDDYAAYTKEQETLNEEGVRAIIDGDFHRAIAVLDESLILGELNITYLNLGRAYQKHGNCEKAAWALGKALTAPKVRQPSPKVIAAKVAQYREELEETCSEEFADERAENDESSATERPKDGADEESENAMVAESTNDETELSSTAERPPESSGGNVAGWALVGSGVAVALGAGGFYLWSESVRNGVRDAQVGSDGVVEGMTREQALADQQRGDTLATVGLVSGVVGAALVGTGAFLLLKGGDDVESVSIAPSASGGASIVWTHRF